MFSEKRGSYLNSPENEESSFPNLELVKFWIS